MGGGTNGLILFIAPIPEATFLENVSMCVYHRRFSSINIPSDLIEETCSIATLSIESLRPGQTINVGRPNMLGEPTFYRLATVFDDHSTCWMMLEHV